MEQIINMEEINRIKEMITNIFETNAKVTQILQEREADNNADEERRHQINDSEDSFQRLEKRIQEGDDEFQELENMVRDLVPRVERAASLVSNYTRHLNKERNRCVPVDLGTTKLHRSRGQQHNNGGSEYLSQRGNSHTNIQNFTTGHNGENYTLSLANAAQSNTDELESKKKVRFANESPFPQSMNSVDSRGSSMRMKFESPGENENGEPKNQSNDNGYSDDRSQTAKVPVSETGFKQRLTGKDVDNRLQYFRKIQMQIRDNKQTVAESKEEKGAEDKYQGVTPNDSMLKDKDVLGYRKDGIARQPQTLMTSVGGHDGLDVSLCSSSGEEALKRVSEDPDPAQQIANKDEDLSMAISMKDNMEVSAYMNELNRKAKREALKGQTDELRRGVGPVTVLCLDTSGSMEGAAFREMISLAIKFVDGIRKVSLLLGITENIGVSTFGKQTGVLLHITNQYDKVKEVLLTLKAEGPSPMFGGIIMASAACIYKDVTMNGISIGSRIILISDGKGTPDYWHLMGDTVDPNNAKAKLLVNNSMVNAGHLVKSHGNTVYSVPVGDYTEETLAQVARTSGGHIIQRNELNRLVQFAQQQSIAASSVCMCRDLGEEVDREPFLRSMIGVESLPGEPTFDQTKMDILTLALKFSKSEVQRKDTGDKGDVMEEVNTNMPCIGTRVRRGPNWNLGNQDYEGPGTVVGHDSDGKEWTFGDQDGGEGTVGIVCRADPAKTVHVRWPNKTVERYNFGANGRFDVELINQREPSVTSASIFPPKRREGTIAGKGKDARKEMSIEDMNRLNQRK
ncbi:uncharacterized protein LOC110447413 [Mizuhopecten yessoensis]|uniref:uncharacterized protein LOC110447413 n=1 Tax=Mizuhopecten yessoensis TaxID=6573 RepID=UPI000B45B88D|nr:uncharacterized protein LOC110447413 [Mizuhopecten yessoensis]